jgi:hypothetical protein
MDPLASLIGCHAHVWLSNADALYVSMIGGNDNFKAAIE